MIIPRFLSANNKAILKHIPSSLSTAATYLSLIKGDAHAYVSVIGRRGWQLSLEDLLPLLQTANGRLWLLNKVDSLPMHMFPHYKKLITMHQFRSAVENKLSKMPEASERLSHVAPNNNDLRDYLLGARNNDLISAAEQSSEPVTIVAHVNVNKVFI